MNARLAIEEHERFTEQLYVDVNELSKRNSISLIESLSFIISIKVKWCKNDVQKAAWYLRKEKVEKRIVHKNHKSL